MTDVKENKEGALRQIQVLLGASKAARAEGLSGDLIVTHAEIKALSDDRWQLNEAAYENAMTALKTADERDEWRRKCGNARNKVDELARMDREDAESIGMALVAAIPDDAVWDQSPVELYIRAINERDEARNALSNAAREHDALDHVMRVAREGVQPTRRLDWIVKRAERALAGKEPDHDDRPPENSVLKMSKEFGDCRERLREQTEYAERLGRAIAEMRSQSFRRDLMPRDIEEIAMQHLILVTASYCADRAADALIPGGGWDAALAKNPGPGLNARQFSPVIGSSEVGTRSNGADQQPDAGDGTGPGAGTDSVLTVNDPAEFEVYDGDGEFYAGTSGPRERAWAEAMNYAMQCEGSPRIEEVTRRPAPMGEVPPGYFHQMNSFNEGVEAAASALERHFGQHPLHAADLRRLKRPEIGKLP